MAKSKRTARFVILCEDSQQAAFAKHFLRLHGFDSKKIRFEIGSKGEGSGEQHVRTQYVEEVKHYRRTSSYSPVGTNLIVIIDADKHTVKERLHQLDSALLIDGQPKRQRLEKIAIFVPKRNIETWIHYLMGEVVDEQKAYPKLARQRQCKPVVKKLVKTICPLPEDAPPSLHAACEELQRIL
jgi:hypothetical protein